MIKTIKIRRAYNNIKTTKSTVGTSRNVNKEPYLICFQNVERERSEENE